MGEQLYLRTTQTFLQRAQGPSVQRSVTVSLVSHVSDPIPPHPPSRQVNPQICRTTAARARTELLARRDNLPPPAASRSEPRRLLQRQATSAAGSGLTRAGRAPQQNPRRIGLESRVLVPRGALVPASCLPRPNGLSAGWWLAEISVLPVPQGDNRGGGGDSRPVRHLRGRRDLGGPPDGPTLSNDLPRPW